MSIATKGFIERARKDKKIKLKKVYEKPEVNYWYAAELDAIETRMSGGSGGVYIGSANYPYDIELDKKKSYLERECWIRCSTSGAVDFSFLFNIQTTVVVYKKTIIGSEQIVKLSLNKQSTYILSDSKVNNGLNTYLIHIKSPERRSFSIKVSQHLDVTTQNCDKGGKWIPLEKSANPNSLASLGGYRFCWYTPAEYIYEIYNYVSETKFLDWQTYALNAANGASMAAAGYLSGVAVGTTVTEKIFGSVSSSMIFKVLTGFISAITAIPKDSLMNFKTNALNTIKTTGGFDSASNTYLNGIQLRYYIENGLSMYEFFEWDGLKMEGVKGYTGEWIFNE